MGGLSLVLLLVQLSSGNTKLPTYTPSPGEPNGGDSYYSIELTTNRARPYVWFSPESKEGLQRPSLPEPGYIVCWLEDDDYVRCMDSDGNSRTK